MNTIYLIGGAPATGKSTLSQDLAKKQNIPFISSDLIRGWMKGLVSKKNFPELFNFSKLSAEKYWRTRSSIETIRHEQARDKCVFKGIKKFIKENGRDWKEEGEYWKSFIIEGISLHPKFIKNIKTKYKIKPVFLIDLDKERIREIVYTRGLWGNAKTYANWVKEKEIDYLIKTNEYYLKEAKKYGFKYFIIKKNRDETLKEVEKFLLRTWEKINKKGYVIEDIKDGVKVKKK